jgi:hypothetical protein
MDAELPLGDQRYEQPTPRKGSKAWTMIELRRFRALSREHGGLTNPTFAALLLGVSRQRVHQLMMEGKLPFHDIIGRPFIQCDVLEEFSKLERSTGYRWGIPAAA